MRAARYCWCLLVVALALVVGGCGGGGKQTADTTGGTQARGTAARGTQGSASDSLTIGIVGDGQQTDPSSTGMGNISVWASGNVFQYLFDRDPKTDKIIPGLATSWKQSKDGKTLDVELRKGVKFHSGDPFTAQDLVFTWNRLTKFQQQVRYSGTLDRIQVVNPHHVRLHFKAPDVGFIPGGGFPVQSKAYFDKVGEKQFVTHPVGTGPYEVTDVKPGQSLTMKRFDGYWGDAPKFTSVQWRFINDDSTRVNALLAGDVDMVGQVPPALVSKIKDDTSLNLVEQNPGAYELWIQGQELNPKTPWHDPRVRRAIAMAIDQKAIVNDVVSQGGELYPGLAPGDLGYDPGLQPYGYHPDQAKQLLAQAGYPDGFSLQLPYMNGVAGGMADTVSAVVLYLQQVGIKATAKPYDAAQFRELIAGASGHPDKDYLGVFVGTIAGAPEPTIGLMTHFANGSPYARYFNDHVNSLLMKASATIDDRQRAAVLKEVMKAIHDDVGFIPLWTSINHWGIRKGLGFTPSRGNYEQLRISDVTPQA